MIQQKLGEIDQSNNLEKNINFKLICCMRVVNCAMIEIMIKYLANIKLKWIQAAVSQ